MVHQHFMLVDSLSALDNVMLGAEPGFFLTRAKQRVRERLEALMQQTGLHVRLDAEVGSLPVGEMQRLEILKTLYRGARILILDEPTAVLTPQETEQLFVTLRGLKAQGCTILLITHKLKEVMALCDAVTVMRAGQVVQTMPIADTSEAALAEAMVGRKVNLGRTGAEHTADAGAAPLLEARNLQLRNRLGVTTRAWTCACGRARSSAWRVSRAMARANCWKCWPACGHPTRVGCLWVAASSRPRPGWTRRRRVNFSWPTCLKTATCTAWCWAFRPGKARCSATRIWLSTALRPWAWA